MHDAKQLFSQGTTEENQPRMNTDKEPWFSVQAGQSVFISGIMP